MFSPQGPKAPYFWQVIQLLQDPINALDEWSQEYGETIKLGGEKTPPTISFSSPEAIRTIFNAPPDYLGYVQKSQVVKTLLGDTSLIFLPESEHQKQRKLIVPSFHKKNLEKCGKFIINTTKEVMESLASDGSFEVRPTMKKISLVVLLNAVLGLNKPKSKRYEETYQTLIDLFTLFESPLLVAYLVTGTFVPYLLEQNWGIWGIFQELKSKLNQLIYEEIKERRSSNVFQRNDILSSLLFTQDESGNLMTDKEVYDAVIALIFAGFETTAAALSWVLFRVHWSSGVKEKLLEEVNSLEKDAEPYEITRSTYVEAVCNETLRINPPAISAFTRTVKKPMKIGGYYLESGTDIDVSIYLAHRRKEVYPQPKYFLPERFISRQFSSYEFLPFGGGQCRCLGANLAQYEMKLVLATIIKHFSLELTNSKLLKPVRHGIVMIPPDGFRLKLSVKK